MALSLPIVAEEVLDAYPIGRHRCLLDVGGGEGVFLAAAAARAASLELMLFDLPAVAMRGRERLDKAGLAAGRRSRGETSSRTRCRKGADIVSLVRVILDHDDANALKMLQRGAARAGPDGTLLLAEPMAAHGGRRGHGRRLFRLLSARYGPRTAAQHRAAPRSCWRKPASAASRSGPASACCAPAS